MTLYYVCNTLTKRSNTRIINLNNSMKNITKNHILNLRVSKKTYEKISDRAKKNGKTISNLIRSIISDSVEVVTDISSDLMGKNPKEKFQSIVSYHKAKLAQDMLCDNCGVTLKKQTAVIIGETLTGTRYFFCEKCKQI